MNTTSKNILVTQSFGRENEYKRAAFTIMSYLVHAGSDGEVVLFTDNPEWFQALLPGVKLHFVLLTPQKIREMRGTIDFLHRMKIALIEEAFLKFPDYNLVYADSDTFFTDNPEKITRELSEDVASMHLWEYHFDSIKDAELPAGKTFRAFYNLITTITFTDAGGKKVVVTPEMSSWNAGVMLFHPSHMRFINDVYALTDQFYPPTENHASEQYAFSVILQNNTRLIPCEPVNYHYWYRIKKQVADLFLAEHINTDFSKLSLKQKLEQAASWVNIFPGLFDRHILTIQDNAIQNFHTRAYNKAYYWTFRALVKKPLDIAFIKNVLYFTKQRFSTKN